jgi:uncharacterized SAM-dependent methyltransferase
VRAAKLEVGFEAGERMKTESSYKFTNDELVRLASKAGFGSAAVWSDRAKRFSVHLLVRR